jgi:hypothetical protein
MHDALGCRIHTVTGLLLQPAVASELKLEDVYQHKAYGEGEGSVISGRAIVETSIRLSKGLSPSSCRTCSAHQSKARPE